MDLRRALAGVPIVPIIQADSPDVAIAVARALHAGGLPLVEVVLRTATSLECLEAVVRNVPEIVAGAGTVLDAEQLELAVRAGARFIVSPGLDDRVVAAARANAVPVLPGVITPTEVLRAHALGLDTVKFFPAAAAGGVPALKALASVFPAIRFVPTGGISAANLADFLRLPAVLACGGSWLTPPEAIAAGDFGRITALSVEARRIADESVEARRIADESVE